MSIRADSTLEASRGSCPEFGCDPTSLACSLGHQHLFRTRDNAGPNLAFQTPPAALRSVLLANLCAPTLYRWVARLNDYSGVRLAPPPTLPAARPREGAVGPSGAITFL